MPTPCPKCKYELTMPTVLCTECGTGFSTLIYPTGQCFAGRFAVIGLSAICLIASILVWAVRVGTHEVYSDTNKARQAMIDRGFEINRQLLDIKNHPNAAGITLIELSSLIDSKPLTERNLVRTGIVRGLSDASWIPGLMLCALPPGVLLLIGCFVIDRDGWTSQRTHRIAIALTIASVGGPLLLAAKLL